MVLLVLDPQPRTAAILKDPAHHVQQLRRSVHQLKQRQYQIVFVDGIILTEEERKVSLEDSIQSLRAVHKEVGIKGSLSITAPVW